MSPITDDLRPTILFITGISFFLTVVIAFLIRRNIDYWIRRLIPQLHEKPPVDRSVKTILLGGFFWLFLASTIIGAVLYSPSAGSAPANDFEHSFTLPTPENALVNAGVSPIRIEVSFPPALDPCSVDALTLLPDEVDPYDLPPIYPINEWFERHEFVNRAFARISITNTNTEQEIPVANRVITRVTHREETNDTYNAAYTICNQMIINELPQIDIDPAGQVAGKNLGQEQYISLRPWNREVFEVELVSQEPGIYDVEVGIEYMDGDQVIQVWSDKPLRLFTPESFHRWSAGVVIYWGRCSFESGEYICEELEYEEPVLVVDEGPQETGSEEGSSSDSTDPRTCRPAPPSRLSVGAEASVSYRLSLRLRIREAPGLESNIISAMNRGTEMEIVEGPVCQDGYLWWKIEQANGIAGWSAEGEPRLYYLEP